MFTRRGHRRVCADADHVAKRAAGTALRALAARCEEREDLTGAERRYREALDRGDFLALRDLARLREQAGDSVGAEAFALQALNGGDIEALLIVADLRADAGDSTGAEALILQIVDRGSYDISNALRMLAGLRERVGDFRGADLIQRFGLTGTGRAATGLDFGPYGGLPG